MASEDTSPAFVFLCALPPEAAAARLGLTLAHWREGAPLRSPGQVRITGMGPSRARRASSRLASSLPESVPVVVLGVGGALVRGLQPGDLVVANAFGRAEADAGSELELVQPCRALDERSQELAERLCEALVKHFPSTISAPVLSARRTARGPERERLGSSGAVICDTESAWLARLAERRAFAVVRAIVDTPERELVSLETVTGGIAGLKRIADAAGVVAATLAV
jgi:4-hydroxy-3-methylbut-2-en-1-yl diphosphate reductase